MFNILTLNKISQKGLDKFKEGYNCSNDIENPDAIMLRSFSLHEMEFSSSLLAIGRCGAGVNNIPVEKCSKQGIVVFNTPGANSNAVKELVLTGLLLSSRRIVDGINWAKSLQDADDVTRAVEKGKSQFAGPEIKGKKLGVIGLGAIGIEVANCAINLGMDVYGFDPYISIDAAWGLSCSVKNTKDLDTIFKECDYITIHVPLNDKTQGMINQEAIDKMKNSVRILNFSRGKIVNTRDICNAINSKKVACYVTDFPDNDILKTNGTISIPHLGASTPEAEDNCAVMASNELMEYLENGNIINSVNLPNLYMPRDPSKTRLCVIHNNIPNIIGSISTTLSEEKINIEHLQSKSKGEYAYAMFDLNFPIPEAALKRISSINGVIRIRVIK